MHSAASERPAMHCRAPQRSPPTCAAESRGSCPIHSATPDNVIFMLVVPKPAGGSSAKSASATASAGGVNTDGSTPLTLNKPASSATAGMSTPSAAGMAHDSVVNDSHAGSLHGAPASQTTRPSIVACAGGCRPAVVQSAVASRDAGRRSTIRPPPAVRGDSPSLPPGARATSDDGSSVTVVLSCCGTPPVPACATHTVVINGAVAAAGSRNDSAHDTVVVATTTTGLQDTLALVGRAR